MPISESGRTGRFRSPRRMEVRRRWIRRGINTAVISSTRSLFVNWLDGNTEASRWRPVSWSFISFPCIGPPEFSHKKRCKSIRAQQGIVVRGVRLAPQFHTYHLLYEPFIDNLCEQAAFLEVPVQLPLRVL